MNKISLTKHNGFDIKYINESSVIVSLCKKSRARMYWYNDDYDSIYIEGIFVNPKERNNGNGDCILKALEDISMISGFKYVYLWVDKKKWMHAWYVRKGYETHSDHECKDFVWMKKSV